MSLIYDCSFEDYVCTKEAEDALIPAKEWWTDRRVNFVPPRFAACGAMDVDETLLWRMVNSKMHVLISGQAGSGKSHLLRRFLRNVDHGRYKVELTAPTGVAAYNVGGRTIHSALALGVPQDDPRTLWERISGGRNKFRYAKAHAFLQKTDILIIDEVSMVDPGFFTMLDYLFRKSRKSKIAFGGVILVMVGDFTQLGPVIKKEEMATRVRLFETECWKSMKMGRLFLNRNHRQKEGGKLLELLTELRKGSLSNQHQQLMESMVGVTPIIEDTERMKQQLSAAAIAATEVANNLPDDKPSTAIQNFFGDDNDDNDDKEKTEEEKEEKEKEKDEEPKKNEYNGVKLKIQSVMIFSTNKLVNDVNHKELEKLGKKNPISKFAPKLGSMKVEHWSKPLPDPKDEKRAEEMLGDRGKLLRKFPLFYVNVCKGAPVMMRCNKYLDQGIYNGSLGIVTKVEPDTLHINFQIDGKVSPEPTLVQREEFRTPCGKSMDIVMNQFPISLAKAITIHKVQGLTLPTARIDLGNCFEAGQLYVAMSRVPNIRGISLIKFNPRSLKVDEECVKFETILKKRKRNDEEEEEDRESKKLKV